MMQVRNPKRNHDGTIDLEIDHPKFGWITFTASPSDPEEHGRKIFAEAEAGKFGEVEDIE